MKQLIHLIQTQLRKWYYYQELKELSLVAAIVAGAWFLYHYGLSVAHWLFTGDGSIYLTFFMASMVIGISLKIYYRLMEIKYYDRDSRIKLFNDK